MALQEVLPDLLRRCPAREQPRGVQGHVEDTAGGLIGFDADILRRLYVLPAQVEKIVAAAEDSLRPGMAVQAIQLGQALEDDADADFP